MRKRCFWVMVICLCTFTLTYAHNPVFNIEQYDNRNGLSNSAINHLFIDRDRILWIGTWDGLNYYDGSSFQHVNYARPENHSGISHNVIQYVQEDASNNIWITTIGGISRLNKTTGVIYNYFYNTTPNESLSEHEYGLAVNRENNLIYAYSPRQGLLFYDNQKLEFIPIKVPVQYGKPVKLLTQGSNLYLLNTEGTLHTFAINNHQLQHKHVLSGIKNCFIVENKLFVTDANKFLNIYHNDVLLQKLIIPDYINAIGYYKQHYLFSWAEKGFAVYDSTFRASSYMNDLTRTYSEIKITAFGSNKDGSLWIGTDGNGILKITPRSQAFGLISFTNLNIPYNVPVRTFCQQDNDLWVGTKGKGIIVLKDFATSPTLQQSAYKTFSYPSELDNNSVYALKASRYYPLIYIGSDALGLGIFHKPSNRFYKWKDIEGHEQIGSFGSVYTIFEDTDSSLWLGTSGYGLIHIKFNIQHSKISIARYEKFVANGSEKGPINNIIYTIADGGNDYLWIGCRYGGLNLFHKQRKLFKEFTRVPEDKALSNNDVLYVYNDSKGNIWVGTSYGLNLLKNAQTLRDRAEIIRLGKEEGLPNNTIHGITEDAQGNIWISTNKGIAKITQLGKIIITYQESDGLQSSEFSDGSVWKNENNRIFFGGIAGFNNFDPAEIHSDPFLPNLLINNLILGGVADNPHKLLVIPPKTTFGFISQQLERKSNYFELSLKPINFDKAEKCAISYQLVGYDKSWHTEKGTVKITYSNLPVGSYKLRVKWSNGENTWSEEKEILQLTVKQYWWLTNWALLLYSIVVSAIVYTIYKYRRDSIAEKHKLEKEKLERAKEEEIHQNRISFFTNIAHELQTPLTIIMGCFDRILDKKNDTGADSNEHRKNLFYKNLIQQQTAKLTYLLQQLFEFRKIETPYFQKDIHYIDITALLKNLAEPFVPISDNKQLHYEYHIEENIQGGLDKDKIEKIVFNLLSNAFKYTPDHETIRFEASKINKQLHISVFNSGIQLHNEQVQKLFDLFYTSYDRKNHTDRFGTGIGLAFTKQLVDLMEGSIRVYNKEDGVCFEVNLPIQEADHIHLLSDNVQPSYLYNILTRSQKQLHYQPPTSINKNTVLNTIVEEDKDTIIIVEDEAEIRYLLRDILKEHYHIYEAENGSEGLHLIHQYRPALVISDVVMSQMDGLELCNIIKNTNAICHIPVILLSAKSTDEQQLQGYDAGADAYIPKPFNPKHLLIRVKKLIEYRKKVHAVLKENNLGADIKTLGLQNEDEAFLMKVYEIIQDHLIDPDLNAQFLEKKLCMSRMQLYRKLKSLSNMTPNEFIKNVRLTTAAKLLQTTKLPVADIFYQTGFNNQSYFFREFKKKYQLSPNEYREKFLNKA